VLVYFLAERFNTPNCTCGVFGGKLLLIDISSKHIYIDACNKNVILLNLLVGSEEGNYIMKYIEQTLCFKYTDI